MSIKQQLKDYFGNIIHFETESSVVNRKPTADLNGNNVEEALQNLASDIKEIKNKPQEEAKQITSSDVARTPLQESSQNVAVSGTDVEQAILSLATQIKQKTASINITSISSDKVMYGGIMESDENIAIDGDTLSNVLDYLAQQIKILETSTPTVGGGDGASFYKRGTTAERPSFSKNENNGFMFYDTTVNECYIWNGTEWKPIINNVVTINQSDYQTLQTKNENVVYILK